MLFVSDIHPHAVTLVNDVNPYYEVEFVAPTVELVIKSLSHHQIHFTTAKLVSGRY